ncbi:porin [Paraburkholderia sp. J8-2]|uniref:porin n=1 Tax=Paraburkholderia sp. J8-2 TaxID=2805440 RepID=UPI002AB788A6|nr:porin [Paraburkholderia sp. J8-2]
MRARVHGMCGIALALAAGGAAAADSSVTLYGVADTYLQYLGNGGSHTFAMKSGGSTGSLFGLKGVEDLGGGLTAQFTVESGFNINNGGLFADTSTLFYRQSWVGLKDERYGSLTFGRQYDASFRVVYPTDPFKVDETLSPFAAFVLTPERNTLSTQYDGGRLSNSVLYQTPKFYGVQAYAMYAFPATVTQPVTATTGNVLNLGINYSGAGLYAGFAYLYQHPGQETITGLPGPLTLLGTEHFIGALAYRIGIVNLQANYSYQRANDPAPHTLAAALGTAHSLSIAEVGATIQATSVDEIQLAALYRNVRGAHDNTPGFQIGADHWISKRTSFYVRAGYFKNNGSATVSWPGVSVTQAGTKQYMAALGMTHRF